jgi:flagellar M-ring protein FliF
MDFLKSQFGRLPQQFNQLNASQKMLSVALLAIMAMTLMMWGRYAGTAEMEPLLDQDLSAEDFGRIARDLRDRNIPFTPSGSRILVPADRRYEVLASLGYDQALPKDMSSAFTELMAKMDNPLNSPEKTAMIQNEAKQLTLAEIIRKFPKVAAARVVIDSAQRRAFNNPVTARASVFINMKSGAQADGRLVDAAADLVCGSVAGLQRSDVKVIVDGISRLFTADDGSAGGATIGGRSWMERVMEAEQYYGNMLAKGLSVYDNPIVHVSVRPKDESSEIKEEKFDPKSSVSKESESETETQTVAGANRAAGGDVGVNPNTGSNQRMSIAGGNGSGGDGGGTFEKTRTKTENRFGSSQKITRNPAGSVDIMSASVGLPRSFFIKAYKVQTRSDKEPGDAVLNDFMKAETDRVKTLVQTWLTLAPEKITVEAYTDIVPLAAETTAPVTSGVSMLVGGHAKEIALGALAVISLFMVSMMVRKGAPTLAVAGGAMLGGAGGAAGATVDTMLATTTAGGSGRAAREEAATEVAEGRGALDGVELDSEAVRSQQVVEQVSGLVKENPDSAAAMIKRWMNRA